jgi:dephospho-CoA kinase
MIRVGLTGSIGMGKSAVAAMFMKLGVPVFRIEKQFPGSTDRKGVNRQKLGQMVFGNANALRALEAIVHPAVYRARTLFLRKYRSRNMVVLDIPLLFEKSNPIGRSRNIDVSIVVSAPAWKQSRRVLKRTGMTHARLRAIKSVQMPDHIKRRRADYIVATGCLKNQTFSQVRRLVTCLASKKGG